MLIAVVLAVMWLAAAFNIFGLQYIIRRAVVSWLVAPLPFFALAVAFGGNEAVANMLAILFLLGIIAGIVGAVFALQRRAWGLAVAGAVGALICSPLPGVIAAIFTAISRHEFARSNSALNKG